MKKRLLIIALMVSVSSYGQVVNRVSRTFHNDPKESDVVEREFPSHWKNFVKGGQFIDRFLPMTGKKTSKDVWGGDNVAGRYIDNGIEANKTSFWGGNVLLGDDGLYHFFVCGWAENAKRGHRNWGRSILYHAIGDNSVGPFEVKDSIGYGHNVDTYRLSDGSYATYVFSLITGTRTYGLYFAPEINGPWNYETLVFEPRDRRVSVTTNFSFVRREDGSWLSVAKDGKIWFSRDGRSPFKLMSDSSTYPNVPGYLEDPAIWRDNVQYHMVMNDAKGRVAYYMRSLNGFDWLWEEGVAYRPGLLSYHKDGYLEDWHKYERMKVFQDKYGRVTQVNFAVLDTDKGSDKGGDNHSSKNIAIPLNPGMLMEWEGRERSFPKKDFEPKIRIKAEENFNPSKVIDIASLRFGDANEVNFGRGSRVIESKIDKNDLILTFEKGAHKITADEFAPKIIGATKGGTMVYGYTRLPWVEYEQSYLSPLKPQIIDGKIQVVVENMGLKKSSKSTLILKSSDEVIATASIAPIAQYESLTLTLTPKKLPSKEASLTLEIFDGKKLKGISRF